MAPRTGMDLTGGCKRYSQFPEIRPSSSHNFAFNFFLDFAQHNKLIVSISFSKK